ncbi:hypothetical protein SOVF_111600, partial [Spinacia oleracea]
MLGHVDHQHKRRYTPALYSAQNQRTGTLLVRLKLAHYVHQRLVTLACTDEVAASTDGSGSLGSHRNKNRKNNRHHSGNKNRRGGRNSDGGKGGSGSGGGRHGGGRNSGGGQGSAAPQLGSWQWVPNYTPPPPPCPIPAQGWARPATGPTRSSGQQGVLVPHPQHVYAVLAPTASKPEHSSCREALTKVFNFITIIHDIYDVYGTIDEVELFTNAIKRWDINAIDELPDYMKLTFLALYNTINEIGYQILKQKGVYCIPYLKKT